MAASRREGGEGPVLTAVEFQVLLSLAEGPLYGLAISREVWGRTGGGVSLGAGTLYPAFKRMTENGLIEPLKGGAARPSGDTRRRHYALTPAGRRALAEEVERMSGLVKQARERGVEPLDGEERKGIVGDPILSLADDPFDDETLPADASTNLDSYLYR